MARTDLFWRMRRLLRLARAAERARMPTREVVEIAAEAWRLSRRDVLRAAAGGAAVTALPLLGAACAKTGGGGDAGAPDAGSSAQGPTDAAAAPNDGGAPSREVKIAIVGAGLAGLTCAYRLKQARLAATVYEAGARVGGRTLSVRGMLADGQVADLGGELIDTEHTTVLGLCRELGIAVDDRAAGSMLNATYRFAGRSVTETALVDAFRPLIPRIQRDFAAVEASEAEFDRVDAMSLAEWLDAAPEANALAKSLLGVAYVSEYGLDTDQQSALNLIYLLDVSNPNDVALFGDSDERYHVHAGAGALATRLAGELPAGAVETETRLVALDQGADRRYRLVLERGATRLERDADHVVLALPFTTLRQVDLRVELPAAKLEAIRELGYGTSSKLVGQWTSRVWADAGDANGTGLTDEADLQSFWDGALGQDGRSGLLTVFRGGRAGVAANAGTPEERMQQALPALELLFPGSGAAYRAGSALRMDWVAAPFALGSYACYRPGQWSFNGEEGARVGNVHFCGEHCSADNQSTMEGAAETGAAVAKQILMDLGLPT